MLAVLDNSTCSGRVRFPPLPGHHAAVVEQADTSGLSPVAYGVRVRFPPAAAPQTKRGIEMANNQLTERDKYIRRLFFHEWAMRHKKCDRCKWADGSCIPDCRLKRIRVDDFQRIRAFFASTINHMNRSSSIGRITDFDSVNGGSIPPSGATSHGHDWHSFLSL